MKLSHLLFFSLFIGLFILLFVIFVPIDINKLATLVINSDETSLIVDKKVHHYINQRHITRCSVEIDKNYYTSSINYSFSQDDLFVYWLEFDTTYTFIDQSTPVNVEFSKLPLIQYVWYFI